MTVRAKDILIVDDTPDNIRFLSMMLLEQGYNVRKAINGKMALTAVQTVIPDLILLDINMPEMSGYEVCQQLKADDRTRSIPVIFLSALDDISDKVKAFQVGGSDYISKPFQFEEVLARVENQIALQSLQQQLQAKNTQLQHTLEELQTTQAQLIQQEKMIALGQLVAGIAHEINNPISFIYSNISPAREYISDLLSLLEIYQEEYPHASDRVLEKAREIDLEFLIADLYKLIDSMKTGADRVRTIVLGLRTFSHLDESELKTIDIREGIESALMLLQHRLESEDGTPEIEVIKNYGDLPKITCYARQLNQVFFNILDNAIDAIEESNHRERKIWISTELRGTETAIIRIKDNGMGMSEEVQNQIFDPFFTTKPIGQGRGLGLSSSYQIIVEQHRGQLSCHSVEGKGTELTIELPVALC
ncbi:MAG TPA: response regulator [Oscillatoriales cyanobacterium M59_W2019_021]|nr:MAG: hybrid sensor histidine kinase/response regulator [Cyanobacteria bacterium J055]HIK29994.1 response regulator [Oscillatoriales cyanobacterium M4454_W2019_049]HIK49963.1 response regulator [Oscillatoriales cyanobacterium M59_W2019_021]